MPERVERIGDSVIVYDDARVDQASEDLFALGDGPGVNDRAGRGNTRKIAVGGRDCVLRHYYRGGKIRHLSDDRFVWLGEARTRSFREWRLLAELRRLGLPVPRPIAARYIRGGWSYTADLVTGMLDGVQSLADVARLHAVTARQWHTIGTVVASFHAQHVFHADLNADNIQLRGDEVFVLDFDRGRIMPGRGRWCERNLARLHRSLEKFRREDGAQFSEAAWQALRTGYDGAGQTSA